MTRMPTLRSLRSHHRCDIRKSNVAYLKGPIKSSTSKDYVENIEERHYRKVAMQGITCKRVNALIIYGSL